MTSPHSFYSKRCTKLAKSNFFAGHLVDCCHVSYEIVFLFSVVNAVETLELRLEAALPLQVFA